MSLKRKAVVESAAELEKTLISNVGRYSARTLPAAGALVRPEDDRRNADEAGYLTQGMIKPARTQQGG